MVRDNWDMMYSMCQVALSDLFSTPPLFFYILFQINPVLTWPYRVRPTSHSWKRHLKPASHREPIQPRACKQWKKDSSPPPAAGIQVRDAPCRFWKSADPDVILTGAEPGEVFGSDTLRSYYFPPTFSASPTELSAKDSTWPIQDPNCYHVND